MDTVSVQYRFAWRHRIFLLSTIYPPFECVYTFFTPNSLWPIPLQRQRINRCSSVKRQTSTTARVSSSALYLTMTSRPVKSRYTKIRVEDLLNDAQANSSHNIGVTAPSTASAPGATNDSKLICTYDRCHRAFPSSGALLDHQNRAHGVPTRHICGRCNVSFSTLPNLNKHVSFRSPCPITIERMRISNPSFHADC